MIHYKLLVVHWSIFTLSVQLIYCASLHSTRDSVMTSAGGVGLSSITVSPIYKSSQSVSHQSICFAETEHMLSVNGKESSIVLDLEPNRIQLGPCKRTFKAPEPHGFIVKLLKFKSKQMRNPNSHIDSNVGGVSIDVYNETTTCPLNIMTGKDPLTPPWKLDPCKMEAHGINKEMVKLTEGLLRISWTPNRHSPKYKLIITTLGKGYHCNQGKHPCLKFGQETLFCVSSSLVCDGINHCPSGDEYNSDEDPNLCAQKRGFTDSNTSFGLSIWQQISKEFFSKLYPPDATTTVPTKSPMKPTSTMHKKPTSPSKDDDGIDDDSSENNTTDDGVMESSTTKHYRHITLSRGLSKYGPWGYLILGMLLCGGALLVCVLWGSSSNANFNGPQPETTLPPNYDEIDPPPSYATLFPGNKSVDAESTSSAQPTANSLSNDATQGGVEVVVAPCAASDAMANGSSSSSGNIASAPPLPSSSTSS
ncbi:uncharacterized protein LOC129577614 isoform X2 [Sitodiplosis mosellana]|uniref:uncharacterized protein LOC129577614 isoform X2 n=1 Tax=Sitodiplosis mosellana TaxID=263140 RepID=UPI0024445BD2|nr:uncharacterized protein LOC129577614 isoform X2 [Sitodiplosis mosellana]